MWGKFKEKIAPATQYEVKIWKWSFKPLGFLGGGSGESDDKPVEVAGASEEARKQIERLSS